MLPTEVSIALIPINSKYIILYDINECSDGIKVIDLKIGRSYSELSGLAHLLLWTLKHREFSLAREMWQKVSQKLHVWVGFKAPFLALGYRVPCTESREKPLGAKGICQLMGSRKWNLSPVEYKDLNCANNLDELGNEFFPGSLKKSSLGWYVDYGFLKSRAKKSESWLELLTYETERVNLCCFKLLGLWLFSMATVENEYSYFLQLRKSNYVTSLCMSLVFKVIEE